MHFFLQLKDLLLLSCSLSEAFKEPRKTTALLCTTAVWRPNTFLWQSRQTCGLLLSLLQFTNISQLSAKKRELLKMLALTWIQPGPCRLKHGIKTVHQVRDQVAVFCSCEEVTGSYHTTYRPLQTCIGIQNHKCTQDVHHTCNRAARLNTFYF